MSDQLTCPKCGNEITITDALSKQLSQKVEQELRKELQVKEKQASLKMEEAQKLAEQLKKQQSDLETEIKKKTEEQLLHMKKEMWPKAQRAAADELGLQIKDLKEQLEEKSKKAEDLEKQELTLRKQQRQLEESKKEFELQLMRKMDEERKIFEEKIEKQAEERNQLKLLEYQKQLEDTKKALLEAQRKAAQGSQQNQGEVLELDLEKKLHDCFPRDGIEPVGKGITGADIIQNVCNNSGSVCGVVLWEVKQTKHWTEGWVIKFKDDLRSQKANIPVLVTTSLPKDIDGFGFYNGVWVTLPQYAVQLAIILRKNLLDVAYERSALANKGEKAEMLFSYVSSHEFRQRVEALVEVFKEMQNQVLKEKIAFEKSWKQREMQLERLLLNTAGMYGEMQGLVGSAMPEIKGLELESDSVKLEDGNKKEDLSLF